jgi:23S rRNA (uracil1939-C5)-methyltransferase
VNFEFPVTFIVQDHSGMNVIAGDLEHPPAIHPMPGETMSLTMPPGGFSQINLDQNRTLVSLVMKAVAERTCGSGRILDLYCGMGNFTLPLASMCNEIHGVDAARASIQAAISNAASNRVCNCSFETMPVESFVRSEVNLRSYDSILLDPPRSGAMKAVRAISRTTPASVIYVSCDPMTLARDLKILLSAGYSARWSRPVDLFPHTYHIESVTVLDYRD